MNRQCEKCKYYIKNICSEIREVCEDYKEVPKITEEDKKYWKKECNASKYRRKSYYYSSRNGYSVERLTTMC